MFPICSLYIWNQVSIVTWIYWELKAWFQIYRELEDDGMEGKQFFMACYTVPPFGSNTATAIQVESSNHSLNLNVSKKRSLLTLEINKLISSSFLQKDTYFFIFNTSVSCIISSHQPPKQTDFAFWFFTPFNFLNLPRTTTTFPPSQLWTSSCFCCNHGTLEGSKPKPLM